MSKTQNTKKTLSSQRYPSLDMAEAKIKQSLLLYKVLIERNPSTAQEKEKVRL